MAAEASWYAATLRRIDELEQYGSAPPSAETCATARRLLAYVAPWTFLPAPAITAGDGRLRIEFDSRDDVVNMTRSLGFVVDGSQVRYEFREADLLDDLEKMIDLFVYGIPDSHRL